MVQRAGGEPPFATNPATPQSPPVHFGCETLVSWPGPGRRRDPAAKEQKEEHEARCHSNEPALVRRLVEQQPARDTVSRGHDAHPRN